MTRAARRPTPRERRALLAPNRFVQGLVKKFNTEPRESVLEGWLVRLVKKSYGKAYKFTSPGHRSVPDRIIVFRQPEPVRPRPRGHVFLCELKRRGKKPTPKQWGEIQFWRSMGVNVYVCDTKESCLEMLEIEWRLCYLH